MHGQILGDPLLPLAARNACHTCEGNGRVVFFYFFNLNFFCAKPLCQRVDDTVGVGCANVKSVEREVLIELFPISGQLLGGDCHNLFFGAVEGCAAGFAIKHQLAASIHGVALRMVLFCANGIALQLLFAFYVVRKEQSVLI